MTGRWGMNAINERLSSFCTRQSFQYWKHWSLNIYLLNVILKNSCLVVIGEFYKPDVIVTTAVVVHPAG